MLTYTKTRGLNNSTVFILKCEKCDIEHVVETDCGMVICPLCKNKMPAIYDLFHISFTRVNHHIQGSEKICL